MKNDILTAGEVVMREGVVGRININDYSATGGNLILTNLRIIYVITKHKEIDCVISLSEIARKENKFDIYSDTPNVVKIRLKSGMLYEFSVKKGEKSLWEADIEKAIDEYMKKYPPSVTGKTPIEETIELEEISEEIEEIEEQSLQYAGQQNDTILTTKKDINSLAVIAAVLSPIAGIFFKHGFWLFLLIGIGFCYWDESVLHHSGHDTMKLTKAYLIPVYLFKRARMLGTGMEYFVLWILTFIIGIIGSFTNLHFWIKLLEIIKEIATKS